MPAFICFHIFTASFIFSKIFTRFEVAFIPASFPFLEFYASKCIFFNVIQKCTISLFPRSKCNAMLKNLLRIEFCNYENNNFVTRLR